MQRKEIIEKELSSYEGRNFLLYQSRNGQVVAEMAHRTREMFAENNLSIAEAKGFLDYMKLVIEFNPCILANQK